MSKSASFLGSTSSSSSVISVPWEVYLSRGLSAWGDRLWSFVAGLFMSKMDNSSLRLVAIYGFINSMAVILLGAAIGNWIDKKERMTSAKCFLVVQNGAVFLSSMILAVHFWDELWLQSLLGSWKTWMVASLVIFVATVANLASTGSRIVVEKDWIVVIADGDDDRLAKMNAAFRTLDLTCNIAAPSLAGFLFYLIGNNSTAIAVGCWNVVSLIAEYLLLASIYKKIPNLSIKHFANDTSDEDLSPRVWGSWGSWKDYFQRPTKYPGLALATLYMTVLGFDNITWAYCIQQCVSEFILGILVGISAVVGLCGSLAFPFLRRRLNLTRTGMVGMVLLLVTLAFCVLSIWLPGSLFLENRKEFSDTLNGATSYSNQTQELSNQSNGALTCLNESYISVSVLLFGIILARFGLWISDLSVTQILQEHVEVSHRGSVNGVQSALNSGMDTLKFVLVILLPYVSSFGFLILISYAFIFSGALLFFTYYKKDSLKKVSVSREANGHMVS